MAKKVSPFKLDKYHSRLKRADYISTADNIYAKTWFSNLAVAIFVLIDLFCLKVVWNLVQTEDPMYVWCIALACAAALDVPLAIAAIAEKRYEQNICSKKEKNMTVILSVAVFMIAFTFSFCFRVLTRELSFTIGTEGTMTDTVATVMEAETDANDPSVLFAALFNGVVPLLTSISSYVISFFSYDPISAKLVKLEQERIGLQANILEAEKALAEAGTSEEHCKGLMAREEDLYREFLQQLDNDALEMKQTVRVLLMQKLGSAEDITAMSKSGEGLNGSGEIETIPERELSELLKDQFQNGDEKYEDVVKFTV